MRTLRQVFELLLTALATAWCIAYGYGFWDVHDGVVLLKEFTILVLPAALLLMVTSTLLMREQDASLKRIGHITLWIGILAIALPLGTAFFDLYYHYSGPTHPVHLGFPQLPQLFPTLPGW